MINDKIYIYDTDNDKWNMINVYSYIMATINDTWQLDLHNGQTMLQIMDSFAKIQSMGFETKKNIAKQTLINWY